MDRLRRVLETIQEQFRRLSVSQRLLIASLAVIMAMTFFVVSQYAGSPPMVELLPGQPAEAQTRAVSFLQSQGIPFKQREGRVYVEPGRQYAVLGQMGESQALPGDSQVLFNNLADRQSWTMNATQHRQLGQIALQNELARVIRNFSGIRKASVFIDSPDDRHRGLGQAARKPTATVTVFSDGGLSQSTVDAIASMVAGSKAGLEVESVRVIDGATNRQHRARGEQDMYAGQHLEHTVKIESIVRDKLLDMLQYIEGVVIAVNAQVDIRRTETVTRRVLNPGEGSVTAPTRESTTEITIAGESGGAEAGVRSNVGADIARGGRGGPRESEKTTEAELETEWGDERTRIVDPNGRPTKINATVNVPRSYFVRLWQSQNPGVAEDPDQEALAPVIDVEVARLERTIAPIIETQGPQGTEPGSVVVSVAPDAADALGQPVRAGGGGDLITAATDASPGGLGWLLKNAALGGLAIAALLLLAMSLKRATRPVNLPTAEEIVGVPPALASNEDMFGEADEADAVLAGVEMSDEDLQRRKMVEQVASLVDESPEDAARLLQRWVRAE
jgi:flagellar M-ring protein FliF